MVTEESLKSFPNFSYFMWREGRVGREYKEKQKYRDRKRRERQQICTHIIFLQIKTLTIILPESVIINSFFKIFSPWV